MVLNKACTNLCKRYLNIVYIFINLNRQKHTKENGLF